MTSGLWMFLGSSKCFSDCFLSRKRLNRVKRATKCGFCWETKFRSSQNTFKTEHAIFMQNLRQHYPVFGMTDNLAENLQLTFRINKLHSTGLFTDHNKYSSCYICSILPPRFIKDNNLIIHLRNLRPNEKVRSDYKRDSVRATFLRALLL